MHKSKLLIFVCFFASCAVSKTDYKHYCIKGDPSSLRIIPKKEPFTPIYDSVRNFKELTIAKLKDFEPKITSDYKKVYNEKIQELDNKTYFNLAILIGFYQAYRSRPCDDNAYKDYLTNLNNVLDKLSNLKDLNNDVKKLTNGGGITGTNSSSVIDLVSKYLLQN